MWRTKPSASGASSTLPPPPHATIPLPPCAGQLQRQQTFQSNRLQKVPNQKRAHTLCPERVGVAEGGRGRESMGQLNDAYKLPASALNAFVSMSLPRHELRFTHSHSHSASQPALTLTLSYSLCLIRMQRRRAKSETVYQSEMTEKKRNNRDELQ